MTNSGVPTATPPTRVMVPTPLYDSCYKRLDLPPETAYVILDRNDHTWVRTRHGWFHPDHPYLELYEVLGRFGPVWVVKEQ